MNMILKVVLKEYSNDAAIHNVLSYIYHLDYKPLPIRFYGLPTIHSFPPDPYDIIHAFEDVRNYSAHSLPRQLWHIIICFPIVFDISYGKFFYFADAVARLFTPDYPVCYAYHIDNKTTGKAHSHFHYAVSTSSIIPQAPPLDAAKLDDYLKKIMILARSYNLNPILTDTKGGGSHV